MGKFTDLLRKLPIFQQLYGGDSSSKEICKPKTSGRIGFMIQLGPHSSAEQPVAETWYPSYN